MAPPKKEPPKLTVKLSIPPARLREIFPNDVPPAPKPTATSPQESSGTTGSGENSSPANENVSTPLPESTPVYENRKGIPGPKPGSKRTGAKPGPKPGPKVPKPPGERLKPGPKKRKLDANGTPIPNAAPNPRSLAAKLGPKANQGAINAGLRALDRTGAPCRRWVKSELKLTSFTGVSWALPRWGAPPKDVTPPSTDTPSSPTGSKASDENNKINFTFSPAPDSNKMDIDMPDASGSPNVKTEAISTLRQDAAAT